MRELPRQDVAEDLKVAVRVRGEAAHRLDAILVEHTQRSKVRKLRVVPIGKGEAVVGVEPAVVRVPASTRPMRRDLGLAEGLGHVLGSVDHGTISRSLLFCRVV